MLTRWITLVAVALLLPTVPAEATHEVDHRYVVLGYVRDEAGRAIVGSPVKVIGVKAGMSAQATTDGDGFYVVIIHLHDEDLGSKLRVTAPGGTIEIEARFDAKDVTSHRGTRVDFKGNHGVEGQEMFLETLKAFLER